MSLIKPLIFPPIKIDETPIGYLIRVAELNSYNSYRWLADNTDLREVASKSHKRISQVLLKTSWTNYLEESSIRENIQNLDTVYFSCDKLKFCPLCLNEDGYYKFNWQYRASVACVKHRVWLQDKCATCKSLVALKNSKVRECVCGFDISSSLTEKASNEVIATQRFLEQGDLCGTSLIKSNHQMDIRERMELLNFFSKWLGNRLVNAAGISRNLSDMSTAKPCMADVSEALFSGEVGFNNFLSRLHSLGVVQLNHKHDLFTKFHRSFYKCYTKECFKPLKYEIEHYMHNHWEKPLTKRNKNFQPETIDRHPWIALQKACRDFDLHKSEIKRAVSECLVRSKKEEKEDRVFTSVYRPDLEARLNRLKDTITSKDAASILGLTKRQFSQIRESGLFDYKKPVSEVTANWQFSRTELYRFRKEFLNSIDESDGKDCFTLAQLLKYFGGQIDDGLLKFITVIKNGELKVMGRKRASYSITGVWVSKDEFTSWYKTYKKDKSFISVPCLAKVLGLQQQFTYQLVDNGLIKYIVCGGNKNRYIDFRDLEEFNDKYCILSKLSKSMRLYSKDLIYYLKTKNVLPVDHNWDVPLRQKVYEKSNLIKLPFFSGVI